MIAEAFGLSEWGRGFVLGAGVGAFGFSFVLVGLLSLREWIRAWKEGS